MWRSTFFSASPSSKTDEFPELSRNHSVDQGGLARGLELVHPSDDAAMQAAAP